MFRICYNFRIVGAWRNFCSQAHRNTTARYFLPIELSGNITIMYLENNLASKIQQSQHYTSERDVEGAVPYKRDRIVFFVLSCNGCNRGLVSSTGERCSPLQICCRNFVRYIYSIFKLRSGCDIGYYALGCVYTKYRNAHPRFDTSSLQPVPETHLGFTKSQGLYVPASIKTLSTYPENHHFCCIKNATIAEMLPN